MISNTTLSYLLPEGVVSPETRSALPLPAVMDPATALLDATATFTPDVNREHWTISTEFATSSHLGLHVEFCAKTYKSLRYDFQSQAEQKC